MVFIAYDQMPLINAHADVYSKARGLNFGLSLYLHPCFMYTSCEGSGEPSMFDDAISAKPLVLAHIIFLNISAE